MSSSSLSPISIANNPLYTHNITQPHSSRYDYRDSKQNKKDLPQVAARYPVPEYSVCTFEISSGGRTSSSTKPSASSSPAAAADTFLTRPSTSCDTQPTGQGRGISVAQFGTHNAHPSTTAHFLKGPWLGLSSTCVCQRSLAARFSESWSLRLAAAVMRCIWRAGRTLPLHVGCCSCLGIWMVPFPVDSKLICC